ncbi:hypothetical protein [Flavihumibacter sp. CACIAM 22H1]|uniref:hypothetical protein n=1 Tax=Flavihumibacter sp. CACIAM 22H1 TaxID=1812911 RepID=UPI0025C1198F|nr:hypothetical protein [Flavihumibacter sp. CACIAM 22H1]
MEAIIASYLNPECDSLGWDVGPGCKGIVLIDNEMTDADVWNNMYRTAKRAGLEVGDRMDNVLFAGLRAVPRVEERLEVAEYLLENNPCSILLIDGAGDWVRDTNDLDQAIECRTRMRELTIKYNISILSTLHPNPGSTKPRGHQGSEICREAESVALIKSVEGDARIITTDFDHGKNRHNPKLSAGFRWSEMYGMFVSEDIDEVMATQKNVKDSGKRTAAEIMARVILNGQKALKYSELVREIMDKSSQSEPTAKRRVKDMEGWGIINKVDDYYRLSS